MIEDTQQDERQRLPGETIEQWHARLQAQNSQRDDQNAKLRVLPGGGPVVTGKAGEILESLHPGEPIFILRAKDILSLMALHHYNSLLEMYTPHNEQMEELTELVEQFRIWQRTHPQLIKLPD